MGDAPREIRDILADAMRRERLGGLVRPLWQEYVTFNPEACEQVRLRADHLIRLLAGDGLTIVRKGEPVADVQTSDVVWRYYLAGQQVERIIRRKGDDWQIILVGADGKETVEQTFALADAHANAGLVLTDDPSARTIAGLGRQLAALAEIYRLCAQSTGGQK